MSQEAALEQQFTLIMIAAGYVPDQSHSPGNSPFILVF